MTRHTYLQHEDGRIVAIRAERALVLKHMRPRWTILKATQTLRGKAMRGKIFTLRILVDGTWSNIK